MTEPEAWAASLPPHEEIAPMDKIDTSTAAIAKLLDGVTDGPWVAESGHVQQNGQLYWQVTDGAHAIVQNQFCWCQGDHAANARFIAAARALVPALSAERDDLRAKLDAAVDALRSTLNFIQNTESEMGVILGCGDKARATIAKIKGADHE